MKRLTTKRERWMRDRLLWLTLYCDIPREQWPKSLRKSPHITVAESTRPSPATE